MTKELGVVESDLKDFKHSNKFLDVGTQTVSVVGERNTLEKEYTNFGVKVRMFEMLSQQTKL